MKLNLGILFLSIFTLSNVENFKKNSTSGLFKFMSSHIKCQMDLIVAVDDCSSMNVKQVEKEKEIASRIAVLTNEHKSISMKLITTSKEIDDDDTNEAETLSMKDKIQSIRRHGKKSCIEDVFVTAEEKFYSDKSLLHTLQVLVLMTNGETYCGGKDLVEDAATQLRSKGIIVIVIDMGSKDKAATTLAKNLASDHFLYFESSSARLLDFMIFDLYSKFCSSANIRQRENNKKINDKQSALLAKNKLTQNVTSPAAAVDASGNKLLNINKSSQEKATPSIGEEGDENDNEESSLSEDVNKRSALSVDTLAKFLNPSAYEGSNGKQYMVENAHEVDAEYIASQTNKLIGYGIKKLIKYIKKKKQQQREAALLQNQNDLSNDNNEDESRGDNRGDITEDDGPHVRTIKGKSASSDDNLDLLDLLESSGNLDDSSIDSVAAQILSNYEGPTAEEMVNVVDSDNKFLKNGAYSADVSIKTSSDLTHILYQKVYTMDGLSQHSSLPICPNSDIAKFQCTNKNAFNLFPLTEKLAPLNLMDKQKSLNERLCECHKLTMAKKFEIFGFDDEGRCVGASKSIADTLIDEHVANDCLDVDLKTCGNKRLCLGNASSFFTYITKPTN